MAKRIPVSEVLRRVSEDTDDECLSSDDEFIGDLKIDGDQLVWKQPGLRFGAKSDTDPCLLDSALLNDDEVGDTASAPIEDGITVNSVRGEGSCSQGRGPGRGRGRGRGCQGNRNEYQRLGDRLGGTSLNQPTADSDSDHWNWQKTFAKKDIPFGGTPGPSDAARCCVTPADFFGLYFSDTVTDLLVTETNRYALLSRQDTPSSMSWVPVTRQEMAAFLGLQIAMGVADLPEIHDYWSTEPALEMPWYRSVMPRDRFTQIIRYFHCSNNTLSKPRTDPDYDKLHKVRPILTAVLDSCLTHNIPAEHISVDEQMIGTRCRVSFIQYMPNKPQRYGIKLWALADSLNGYLCNFQVYTGRENSTGECGLSYRVVYDLMQPYLYKGYKLYTDNFYTSPKLMKDLLRDDTYLTGTVRCNRKDFPKELVSLKLDTGASEFLHCNGMTAVYWKDKRDVYCLSSLHGSEIDVLPSKSSEGEDKQKPRLVCDYNTHMGGVDLHDQLQVYYCIGRKGMKWWKRVFWRLCEIAVLNSYVLHNIVHGKSRKMTQKDFRLQLAYSLTADLIAQHANPPDDEVVPGPGRRPSPIPRLLGKHFASNSHVRQRCRVCAKHKNPETGKYKDTKTVTCCEKCNVHLCIGDCFARWHSKAAI